MRPKFSHIALALPLIITACGHKQKTAQNQPLAPPIEDNPPSQPNKAPANLPPSVITIPQQPSTQPKQEPTPGAADSKPPRKPAHHKKPPAGKPAEASNPPANSTQQASNGTPEVSAIGQLSSGEPADVRQQAYASIADTEKHLNKIHRKFSYSEQKTVNQIREFLKQAKAALNSGDTDGAYTLAMKAKVLLGEIAP